MRKSFYVCVAITALILAAGFGTGCKTGEKIAGAEDTIDNTGKCNGDYGPG